MSDSTFAPSLPTGGTELPPGTRLEEFLIERVLGVGGFGITYLARDVSLNRPVVIKENLPGQFAHLDTFTLCPSHSTTSDAWDYGSPRKASQRYIQNCKYRKT